MHRFIHSISAMVVLVGLLSWGAQLFIEALDNPASAQELSHEAAVPPSSEPAPNPDSGAMAKTVVAEPKPIPSLDLSPSLVDDPRLEAIVALVNRKRSGRALSLWKQLNRPAESVPDVARFALGLACADLRRFRCAREHMEAVVAAGGELANLAAARLGRALMDHDQISARQAFARVRAGSPITAKARFQQARMALRAGDALETIEALEGFDGAWVGPTNRVEAHSLRIRALDQAGLSARARQARLALLATHPSSAQALRAAKVLSASEQLYFLVDHQGARLGGAKLRTEVARIRRRLSKSKREQWAPLLRYAYAACDVRQHRYTRADETLTELIETSQDPVLRARSLFQRAISRRRRDLDLAAAADYAAAAALAPQLDSAAFAMKQAIFLAHLRDRNDTAKAYAKTLVQHFTEEDERVYARWMLGWLAYLDSSYDEAIEQWELLHDEFPTHKGWSNGGLIEKLAYWKGRSHERAGRTSWAVAEWRSLVERFPLSFYSHLAYERLLAHAPRVADRYRKRPEMGGLQPGTGPSPEEQSLPDLPILRPAATLIRGGLTNEGWRWLHWLVWRRQLPADSLDYVAALARRHGDVTISHKVLLRLAKFSHYPEDGARNRWLLGFPTPLREEIVRNATKNRIDPMLLFALVRQESGFNARALSRAGAIGLSQVMPPTARHTAVHFLGIPAPTHDQLRSPDTNLRIGARYLRYVLDRFDGNFALAVAAYNAGPGAVSRWTQRWGHLSTDEFIEELPYREAHGYTKLVLQSYGTYRYLYGPANSDAHRRLVLPQRTLARERLVLAPMNGTFLP